RRERRAIEQYINELHEHCNFWQLHRIELYYLYKYASYHLISPATSVASESAFSTASYLLRKQRSRLTPENLSYSMFLKDKLSDEFSI
ncbi:unnamed protein product, partial [Rotaria sp. Silwood1]